MSRRAFVTCTVLGCLLTLGAVSNAWAQPAISQGPNLGTFSIGHVQIPLAATGGNGTYLWQITAGSLPPGLSLRTDRDTWFPTNSSAGVIGVATTPGTYDFTLQVTSAGLSSSRAFTLRVSALLIEDLWQLPDGFANRPYAPHQLTALNNVSAVTWTATSGLPPGMTLSAAGVLSGTPTISGFYTIQLRLQDSVDTAFRSVSIGVYDIEITTPRLLPNATQQVPYSASVSASGGSGTYTFSTCSGVGCASASSGLPTGLVIDESTGAISGTPTAGPGQWGFRLWVTDTNHVSYSIQMAIVILGAPITLPQITPYGIGNVWSTCTLGWPCDLGVFVGLGGTAPFTWTATGLPPGMDIRFGSAMQSWKNPADGEVSGSPSQAGLFNVTVTATDAMGMSTSNTFPLRVSSLNMTLYPPNGTLGVPYSHKLRPIGGPSRPSVPGAAVSDYTSLYTAEQVSGTLPAGLTFNPATFVISGTPVETGSSSSVTFRFTDQSGQSLDVQTSVFIPSDNLSTIQINSFYDLGTAFSGSSFSRQLSACCVPSYAWSLVSGVLPPGLSLSSAGVLSGIPTATGTYQFLVEVSDATFPANYARRQFTLVVTNPAVFFITTPFTLPYGNVGVPMIVSQTVSGGTGPFAWTLVAGSTYLPPGITLSPDGTVSGTPTATGLFSFTLRAVDSVGNVATRGFFISIYPPGAAPPLNLPLGPTFTLAIGSLVQQLFATGGIPPYHYSLTPGAAVVPGMRVQDGPPLPIGFTATGGYLGVLATGGAYNTSIRVTDSAGNIFDRALTLNVSPLRILSESNPPRSTVGEPYSFTLTPYGGSGTYLWSISSSSFLPPGLSLDALGRISGIPTALGSFFTSITLTDPVSSLSITQGFSLTVNPFAITTNGILPLATVGTPYNQTFSAPGCVAPCAWTTTSTLGGFGLSLSADGVLSGTPTFAFNTLSFTVQVTGSNGTVQKIFSLRTPTTSQLAISNSSFGPTVVGGQITNTLVASGGLLPYSWSLRAGDALPPGISLEVSGDLAGAFLVPGFSYLRGRVMEVGIYTFTLDLTDAANTTVSRTFTWNVSALSNQYTSLPLTGTTLAYGVPYSQPLLVIGGTGTYTWTSLGAMPPGLTLNASTGVVSGTPTNTGFFSVPVQVNDDAGNVTTANISLNVGGPTGTTLGFSSGPNLGVFQQGFSTSFTVTPTGGTAPYTVTPLTTLPPGFTLLTGDSLLGSFTPGTFLIASVPLAAGAFSFTLQAQDAVGNIGVRTFTLTVASFTQFSTTLPDASIGVPYSQPLQVFNENPVTWSAAANTVLPPGVGVSAAGVVQGTPTQGGFYFFTVAATDPMGASINFGLSLRVSSISIADPPILPSATVGEVYGYEFSGSGGASALVWSASGLPPGLTMSATGTISGTSLAAGLFSVFVTATDGIFPISRRFALASRSPNPTVLDFPLASSALIDVTVGQFVSLSLNPTGGTPPYTWNLAAGSSLPPGLQIISGSALPSTSVQGSTLLAGVPNVPGLYAFDLIATDSIGVQARRTFTLNVSAISILLGSPGAGTVGVAYSQQFTAVGGTAPYTFSMTPTAATSDMLPPGFALSPAGLIAGTTTSTGNYNFALQVQDAVGRRFVRRYTLVVNNALGLRVVSNNPPDVSIGAARSLALQTSGSSTYAWSLVSGTLPPGFSLLTSGTFTSLSGASPAAGVYTFSLRATDTANAANTADHTFTFRVTPMQLVSTLAGGELPPGQVGAPYTHTMRAAGGTPPYAYSVSPFTPLPVGLSLSAGGVLSGAPQQVGSYFFAVMISDSGGNSYHTLTLLLTVTPASTPPPLLRLNNGLPFGSVGVPYVSALDTTLVRGGTAPFVWSLAAGASLPPGLALLQGVNGVQNHLGGIPTVAGAYTTTLVAADAGGQTVAVPLNLTVLALTFTPDVLPPAIVGAPYVAQITASGGTPLSALQLLAGSGMPPGLSLMTGGKLAGTPTAPGVFFVSLGVTDGASQTFARSYRVIVDNATGQVPGVFLSPRPIQVDYQLGAAAPAPIPVSVASTSGSLPFSLAVLGIPGASILPASGTTSAASSLTFNVTGLGTGTYVGVLGVSVPGAVNRFDSVPVTLKVAPPPPCTYTLSPPARYAQPFASFGWFVVQTATACAWTATTTTPWITITPITASGSGTRTVSYSMTANPGTSERIGTITVNGQVHTVTQFGTACSFSVAPSTIGATAVGGVAEVTVDVSAAGCAWTASSASLALSPSSGTIGRNVTVMVPPNTDPLSRVLTATIAGHTVTVNQTGIGCLVSLSPYEATMASNGGQGSVTIATPAGCSYSTLTGPSWITVTSGDTGTGPGTLVFSVEPNSMTESRSGTLTIGGQPFQIRQEALACSVTVQTSNLGSPYGSTGGAGTIGVTTNGANCGWSASSSISWATLTPASGTGNGTVGIAVSSNASSPSSRGGSVTINGQTVNISQAGTVCTYTLQSQAGSVPGSGGAGSVGVISAPACTWSAAPSNPDWLTITSSGNIGTSDVRFSALANTSQNQRTGTLTVAGQIYSVTQAGAPCTYTLGAAGTSVAADGVASASFGFSTSSTGCTPAAVSFANWITVNNTSFSGGAGTASYSVAPNPVTANRSGTIVIGDRSFTITQLGGQCGFSLNAYGALFDRFGGAGAVLGSQAALGCTPAVGTDQPSFVLLEPLVGPANNIFTLPYSIEQYSSLTRSIRIGRIAFGGVTFTVKQTSY